MVEQKYVFCDNVCCVPLQKREQAPQHELHHEGLSQIH